MANARLPAHLGTPRLVAETRETTGGKPVTVITAPGVSVYHGAGVRASWFFFYVYLQYMHYLRRTVYTVLMHKVQGSVSLREQRNRLVADYTLKGTPCFDHLVDGLR